MEIIWGKEPEVSQAIDGQRGENLSEPNDTEDCVLKKVSTKRSKKRQAFSTANELTESPSVPKKSCEMVQLHEQNEKQDARSTDVKFL